MAELKKKKVQVLRRLHGKLQSELEPIVLEYKELKKKREDSEGNGEEKYSEGLEDVQRLEGDMVRVAKRASNALSKSIETYDRERQRSSKEKTDGAVEDFVHNSAKAASVYMKEASEIPVDLAESMNTKSYQKRLRQSLRQASKIIRLWRI